MLEQLDKIDSLQTELVERWHHETPLAEGDGFLSLVAAQHLENFMLWHEEDEARSPSASDAVIAQVKRNIDGHNQRRNDLIEKLDEALLDALAAQGAWVNHQAPLNSETPGSMIDRCSILALKIFHMNEQTRRGDVDQTHKDQAAAKVAVLQTQRADLLGCLKALWSEAQAGTRQFKIYRQYKMYNDPRLNPAIYQAQP